MFKKTYTFIKELGSLGPLLAFTAIAPAIGAVLLASSSQSWLPIFQIGTDKNTLLFLVCGAILAGLSLIPTHAISLVAGMLFGSIWGSTLAIFCIILASAISFVLTSAFVGDKAIEALRQRPKADAIYQELLKSHFSRTIGLIFLVRLSPLMPFAATNVLLGAAKVKWYEFLIGSATGLAPRIILVAFAGAQLEEFKLSQKPDSSALWLGITASVLSLIIISRLAQKALQKSLHSK